MRNRFYRTCLTVFGSCLALGLPNSLNAEHFMILDAPDAYITTPQSINSHGDIVGYFQDSSPSHLAHGFLLKGGSFTTIDVPGARSTLVRGINNQGDIVGLAGTDTGASAFLLRNEVFTRIMPPGAVGSQTGAINGHGDIVGFFIDNNTGAPNTTHGFLLKDGKYTNIDVPWFSQATIATGINDQGDIVGIYSDWTAHGFLRRNGEFSKVDIHGASSTNVSNINNKGEILGTYYDGTAWHGFVIRPLPPQSGDTEGREIIDYFDYPGAVSTMPVSITDQGVVVGGALLDTGWHGFVLTE